MPAKISIPTKTSTLKAIFITGLLINTHVIAEPDPNTGIQPISSNDVTSPTVKRSQFTTAIVNREPTDNVVMLTNNSEKIYYFTELSNLKGQKITHRWQYQEKPMAEIQLEVKSDRWRAYSSKNIKPEWTGEWSVVLLDENGNPLDVSKLEVIEASSN